MHGFLRVRLKETVKVRVADAPVTDTTYNYYEEPEGMRSVL